VTKTFDSVYSVVRQIPKGKVATYATVAKKAKTTPRVVGFALHANKNPKEIPCHRVIKTDGALANGYAFGGKEKQKELLQKEGVYFKNPVIVDLLRSDFSFRKSSIKIFRRAGNLKPAAG